MADILDRLKAAIADRHRIERELVSTQATHAALRQHVEYLDEDRPLFRDHKAMRGTVKILVLDAVESGIGELAIY